MKKSVWRYDIDKETFAKIEIEEYLIKWTIDIIENPEAHFKAEDDRRFGVYTEHYQSFLSFLMAPWMEGIPKDLHHEISEKIRNEYSVKDLEKSYSAMIKKRFYYWTPFPEKLIFERGSKESSEEYFDVGKGILVIKVDFIDPFDRKRIQELIDYKEIINNPSNFPKEVVNYMETLQEDL